MAKKIPKQLKRTMLTALASVSEPHPTSYFADLTQSLPESCRRSPTQIAFLLKQLQADEPRIEAVEVAKNGISHHGRRRVRKHWYAPNLTVLPDDVEARDIALPPNQILLTIDDTTMDKLRQRANDAQEIELHEVIIQILRESI